MESANITVQTDSANGNEEAVAVTTTKVHGGCRATLLLDPTGQGGTPGLSGHQAVTMCHSTSEMSYGQLGQTGIRCSQQSLVTQGQEQITWQSAKAPWPWGLSPRRPHPPQLGGHEAPGWRQSTTTSSHPRALCAALSAEGPHHPEAVGLRDQV